MKSLVRIGNEATHGKQYVAWGDNLKNQWRTRVKNLFGKYLLMPALLVAMLPGLFLTSSANAIPINGAATGLSSPQSTITFSEISLPPIGDPPFPDPHPIGTAYSGLGVTTFSANVGQATAAMYMPAGPNLNGDAAVNFIDGHWLITFNSLLNGVAFAYASGPGTTTFTALLNGAFVEDFKVSTTFGPELENNFFGFQNILFNQVKIDLIPDSLDNFGNAIDNLQSSAVPEPSSLVLLSLGLAGLAASRRFSFIKSRT